MFSIVLCIRIKNTFGKLGALYLSMSAVYSLLLIDIPMDALHFSKSISGLSHIFVALTMSIFLVIAMLLFSYGFRKSTNFSIVSKYSFGVSMIILIAGFLTGIFALLNIPEYVGLLQKLPITAFLIWVAMTVYWMLKSDKRVHYVMQQKKRKSKRQKRRF